MSLGETSIFLFDPDSASASVTKLALQQAGARNVNFKMSQEDALDIVMKRPPELLLVDLTDDEVAGADLIMQLRKAAKENAFPTRIVALIGQATREALQVAIKAGADTAIAKPLVPGALIKKLKGILSAEIPYLETASYKGPDRRRIPTEDEYAGDERRGG